MGEKDISRAITHCDRMRGQFYTEKGKIEAIYVVQYEAQFGGEPQWRPIVRYDCAHGFFHRDVLHPDGRQDKAEMCFPTLAEALNYAVKDIKENWEKHRARYETEMKAMQKRR